MEQPPPLKRYKRIKKRDTNGQLMNVTIDPSTSTIIDSHEDHYEYDDFVVPDDDSTDEDTASPDILPASDHLIQNERARSYINRISAQDQYRGLVDSGLRLFFMALDKMEQDIDDANDNHLPSALYGIFQSSRYFKIYIQPELFARLDRLAMADEKMVKKYIIGKLKEDGKSACSICHGYHLCSKYMLDTTSNTQYPIGNICATLFQKTSQFIEETESLLAACFDKWVRGIYSGIVEDFGKFIVSTLLLLSPNNKTQ